MSNPVAPVPGTEPDDSDSADAVMNETPDEGLPMSEVARRLSLLGKLIVPRAPQ